MTIFCRKIVFNHPGKLIESGPLLLAANHPNGIIDALLIAVFFKRPVHFLARADAFKNPFFYKVFTKLNAIPIYRLPPGSGFKKAKEYLALNTITIQRCTEVFKKGGIVVIFPGVIHAKNSKFPPIKKGAARIAFNSWRNPEISSLFKVLPVSFNYSTFTNFRKSVLVEFGEPLLYGDNNTAQTDGKQILAFNQILSDRINKNVLHSERSSTSSIKFLVNNINQIKQHKPETALLLKEVQSSLFESDYQHTVTRLKGSKKMPSDESGSFLRILLIILFAVPALIGVIVHRPFYLVVNKAILHKTRGMYFYQTLLFVALVVVYPVYLLAISVMLWYLFKNNFFLLAMFILPISAWVYLQWKDWVESLWNYFKTTKLERTELQQLMKGQIKRMTVTGELQH